MKRPSSPFVLMTIALLLLNGGFSLLQAQLRDVHPIHVKVAVVIQDPILSGYGNKKLHEVVKTPGYTFSWNDPSVLNQEYEAALEKFSHGVVQYEVVKIINDGHFFSRRNDNNEMLSTDEMVKLLMEPGWKTLKETGTHFDYKAFVEYYGFDEMRDRNEINEVWVWSFPYGGMWESNYCGATGFWLNSDPTTTTKNKKLLTVMGLNYERKMSMALESYGHRTESVLWHLYGRWDKDALPPNNWELYTQYDKTHPGEAMIGNIHFPPNGVHDYDWVNKTVVNSYADGWDSYPDIDRTKRRLVDCSAWNCDHLGYMSWWFTHLPHFAGINPADGHLNNWWHYVVNWEEALEMEKGSPHKQLPEKEKGEKKPDKIADIYFLELPGQISDESRAALDFLKSQAGYSSHELSVSELKDLQPGDSPSMVWFHQPDSTIEIKKLAKQVARSLKKYVQKGGKLLLSLDAVRLLPELGLEKSKPQITYTDVVDEGFGRKMGWHGFRSHPIFGGLLGGAYVLAPKEDMHARRVGYFGDQVPQGKVVGVDWAYIFLHEESKLIMEYDLGKGQVLAIGAYLCYEPENYNRKHLELFSDNVFNYLTDNQSTTRIRYWDFEPNKVVNYPFSSPPLQTGRAESWNFNMPADPSDDITLTNPQGDKNPWDISGERMLVMGTEGGGIEEVWAHPFMALRDYIPWIRVGGSAEWIPLNSLKPKVEVRPEAFTRTYSLGESKLREIITVHPTDPVVVMHYEYSGKVEAEISFRMKSNLRFMWPYSARVTGNIYYGWDDGLNAWVARDKGGDHVTLIGINKEAISHNAQAGEDLIVSFSTNSKLGTNDQLDVVLATSASGLADGNRVYRQVMQQPKVVFEDAVAHARSLYKGKLMITGPDSDFNTGYKWALAGTDRFKTHTPGIGRSLVAGFATSAHGWNGGHKVNGRPGYAWYFGRDAVWSGFAVLDYGDFDMVRTILKLFADYQDVSGKIYHELTTSGIAHFDAADATPLYIALAGEYLHHSGDLEFIREQWPAIKKAIDFCYSTDTDGDHLIENTQQGHGWEEGGGLYGTHTTQYMVSCWAEALNQASYMARALRMNALAVSYAEEEKIVLDKLNTDFWNEDTQFFNHGLYKNGSYLIEPSVMTAIPVYWNQIQDKTHAATVMEKLGSCDFTTDWGTRIVSENASFFGPGGYHTGSVWPLFTGWAALGDFSAQYYPEGYAKMMDNLMQYRSGALGYVPEVLHGTEYKPFGVCRHQCWSETMVLQPAIEGMLGLKADVLNGTAAVSLNVPADWNHFEINNIRVGNEGFSVKVERKEEQLLIDVNRKIIDPAKVIRKQCDLYVNLIFPEGTTCTQSTVESITGIQSNTPLSHYSFNTGKLDHVHGEFDLMPGIAVLPEVAHPEAGASSKGIRIISTDQQDNLYIVEVEGLSGTTGSIRIMKEGKIEKETVIFPASENTYSRRKLNFEMGTDAAKF